MAILSFLVNPHDYNEKLFDTELNFIRNWQCQIALHYERQRSLLLQNTPAVANSWQQNPSQNRHSVSRDTTLSSPAAKRLVPFPLIYHWLYTYHHR